MSIVVPLIFAFVGVFSLCRGTDVFSALTDGAKDGLKVVLAMLPPLVAILSAVSMLRASAGCRFSPCTPTLEPGCAVKAAVEEGTISAERYASYLGMLEEDRKFR